MSSLQLVSPMPPSVMLDTLFARVLLGIDFGTASLAAARWATNYVAAHADAILSHVVPFGDPTDDELTSATRRETLYELTPALMGGLGGFAATLDLASAHSVVRVGRPSQWLSAIANAADASLLVLGRRADAARTRVGEPNVIERAARRTRASVLVVPEGTSQPPGHVIAAIDESGFAQRVVRVARQLARMNEVPMAVMHVLSPAAGAYDRVIRTARDLLGGQRKLRPSERPPASIAMPVRQPEWLLDFGRSADVSDSDRVEVSIGDPAREISAAAMTNQTPLVVVGMRGADGAPPGSIGSVARELLKRAPVPVLAVSDV